MKSIIIFFTLILFSCGTQKSNDSTSENGQNIGTVELGENCTVIHTNINGLPVTMYPVYIDAQFKQTDLEIKFDFALSRAAQPTDCIVDRVVSISNVSRVN